MVRRSLMAVLAVLFALALAGCGGSTERSAGSLAATSTAAAPQRVVSLSPTATEMLFAIGAGDQVVAVDDQSTYPAEAPRTKLSGYEPNVEAIAGYSPDVVVASFDPGGLVNGLRKVDVRVVVQPAAKDLAGAYEQIRALGVLTGHAADADRLVEQMESQIAALTSEAGSTGLSVYHEISPDYYSATSQTFIGSIYKLLGAKNIADDAGGRAPDYPQLSAEFIVSANPDLIVLSDTKCCGQTPQTVAARPGWSKLAAVKEGNVVGVDDDIASRWGPRTVDFVAIVARALQDAMEK